jgi:hypothetical protein
MWGTAAMGDDKRKRDRRNYRVRPSFPLIDSEGNLVEKNRRRVVDRRLSHISREELEDTHHMHSMELRLYGQRYHLDQEHPRLVLGRTHLCDIQVLEGPVSREHAIITLKDGYILFEDRSTNGSYIRFEVGEGKEQHVHHKTLHLHGKGVISLGFPLEKNLTNLIRFEAS